MRRVARNPREARSFLCHIWASLSLLVLAAVFFGVSSINKAFVIVGAILLALSLLTFVLFFVCREGRDKRTTTRESCNCLRCCDTCVRTIFCLGLTHRRPEGRAGTLREAMARHERASVVGYDNRAMSVSPTADPPTLDFPVPLPQPTLHSQLRDLETEIHDLLIQSSRIQNELINSRDSSQDSLWRNSNSELANIQDSLGTEFRLLQTWIEGNRTVHPADVDRMRSGLQNLSRRLRQLESRANIRRHSGTDLQDNLVGVASLTASLPPVVHTPFRLPGLPEADLPPPYRERDAIQDAMARFQLVGRPDLDNFRLPSHLLPPLAPPVDDTDAPPSYEEASSSQV